MSTPVEGESLFTPRNFAAFLLVSVIWGGTWLVIRDQIASVPASWSISYRFIVAALGMFALAAIRRERLSLAPGGMRWACLLGLFQFTLNFAFVYNAESYITSGLVAVMFALLVVPNAIFGRVFLGQQITGPFIVGSAIAAIGVALLFALERSAARCRADGLRHSFGQRCQYHAGNGGCEEAALSRPAGVVDGHWRGDQQRVCMGNVGAAAIRYTHLILARYPVSRACRFGGDFPAVLWPGSQNRGRSGGLQFGNRTGSGHGPFDPVRRVRVGTAAGSRGRHYAIGNGDRHARTGKPAAAPCYA